MVGKVLGWLGRKAVLYIAIVAAMLAYGVWNSGRIQTSWKQSQTVNLQQADALEGVIKAADAMRVRREAELAEIGRRAQEASLAKLNSQIAAARIELRELEEAEPGKLDALFANATFDIKAIWREQERRTAIAYLERKIEGLILAAEATRDADSALTKANRLSAEAVQRTAVVARYEAKLKAAQLSCKSATSAVAEFKRSWVRTTLDRLPYQNGLGERQKKRKEECDSRDRVRKTLKQAEAAKSGAEQAYQDAQSKIRRVDKWVENKLPDTIAWLKAERGEQQRLAQTTLTAWASWAWTTFRVADVLKYAAFALSFIIATPFLIRTFCYFVLAPFAMRRPSIRLNVPGGSGATIAPSAPSTTSIAVRLERGEELLVRQDYLQTSNYAGAKDTKWVLNWWRLFTSIATGLVFLTRIRGEGEVTTISATRDGMAEVTLLTLPAGAACVLQPRAIAAVVQPIDRPLRITRHWRLGSLNAWLTLQLRYLVFHGPARIVLKGGRGVRIEPAAVGRVFGQDQLVGFSADLDYAVTRTETFAPYLFGRTQLLKDRVLAGQGVLIVEEAPFTTRHGKTRRGLEGMIDAGMKVFGM